MKKMIELRELVEEYISEVEDLFDDSSEEYKVNVIEVLKDIIVYVENRD